MHHSAFSVTAYAQSGYHREKLQADFRTALTARNVHERKSEAGTHDVRQPHSIIFDYRRERLAAFICFSRTQSAKKDTAASVLMGA